MAYTPCAAVLAANIAKNCENPIVGGYTGRAILIPANKVVFTTSGANPRIVTAITLSDLSKDKVCVVDNVWPNGFDGSQTASNGDDGRVVYEKTFGFRIPLRGGGNSKDVVEPLMDNPLGYVAIIEKKDQSDLDSFFSGGDVSFSGTGIKGLDDFELICFLVIR